MKTKAITRVKSIPKAYMSLKVDGGGTAVQTYSAATGQTFPTRKLQPLVLRPSVGYSLPDTGESDSDAASLLTNIHWYRLDGSNDKGISPENEIKGDMPGETLKKYEIETTAGSPDSGKLTVYVDTQPGKDETYVLVATLNVGEGREVTASFRSECRVVELAPVLMFDNDAQGLYNPWEDPDRFVLTPKITPSSYSAKFSWETLHGGKWGALGSTHLDWALSVNATTGALTIRRSLMQGRVDLRCTAEVTIDGATVKVQRTATHTRRLPWFDYDFQNHAALSAGAKTFSPKAVGVLSRGVLADFTEEVATKWYNGDTLVATGRNPSIAAPANGAEMELGLEVTDRGGWCALADSDGALLTDSDGALLIVRENG